MPLPPTNDARPGEGSKLFGLLDRKPRWGLSWKGWLAVATVALVTGSLAFFCIHPFLAVTQRADSRILVVEGWVHDFAFDAAAKEFKSGGYDRAFATGGPIEGQGGYISDSHTYASIGAEKLVQAGIPAAAVQMVPSRVMERDRTYSSAVALRDWLRVHQVSVPAINVLTEDAHARRSRLLFQEAFGNDVNVGVISVPDPDFKPDLWWKYSQGVREVVGESIAYLYAKLLFWPPKAKS